MTPRPQSANSKQSGVTKPPRDVLQVRTSTPGREQWAQRMCGAGLCGPTKWRVHGATVHSRKEGMCVGGRQAMRQCRVRHVATEAVAHHLLHEGLEAVVRLVPGAWPSLRQWARPLCPCAAVGGEQTLGSNMLKGQKSGIAESTAQCITERQDNRSQAQHDMA
jgi:hypothetical protein